MCLPRGLRPHAFLVATFLYKRVCGRVSRMCVGAVLLSVLVCVLGVCLGACASACAMRADVHSLTRSLLSPSEKNKYKRNKQKVLVKKYFRFWKKYLQNLLTSGAWFCIMVSTKARGLCVAI